MIAVDDDVCLELYLTGDIDESALLAAREHSAWRPGDVGAALLTLRLVTTETLLHALARRSGFEGPVPLPEAAEELDPVASRALDVETALAERVVALRFDGSDAIVAAANVPDERVMSLLHERYPRHGIRIRLTSDEHIDALISLAYRRDLTRIAVERNRRRDPHHSAHVVFTRTQLIAMGVIGTALTLLLYANAVAFLTLVMVALQLFFFVGVAFKSALSVIGAAQELEPPPAAERIDDASLPVYTVLVPVYGEPEVASRLVAALARLDYPAHKLDVIVLFEEDDRATQDAFAFAEPPPSWRLLRVPESQPRTKPKACNYGLLFARGEYLVIYDAEDLPDPGQLRAAVGAFRSHGFDYVCFQAALNYFNGHENLLTRMFTLEYSFWFDYLLPALDRLGLPFPLGGTSNHFDTAKLRELGGWDPYNTTEDADLGIRASVEGYRVGIVHSTTYEEANSRLGNWVRQRSRWFKGYMQTFLVYWRRPLHFVRTVGVRGFLAFNFFVGGTVLSSLAAPPLWLLFAIWLVTRTHAIDALFPEGLLYLAIGNLLFGNFLGIFLNMIAVFKRHSYRLMPYAVLNPIYWWLQSVAAYKALGQLFTRPFYWEKTTHGITRVDPAFQAVIP